jgi:hypothetical protein
LVFHAAKRRRGDLEHSSVRNGGLTAEIRKNESRLKFGSHGGLARVPDHGVAAAKLATRLAMVVAAHTWRARQQSSRRAQPWRRQSYHAHGTTERRARPWRTGRGRRRAHGVRSRADVQCAQSAGAEPSFRSISCCLHAAAIRAGPHSSALRTVRTKFFSVTRPVFS